MSGTKPIYYWDACVYLAWLKKETSKHLSSIEAIAEENKKRNNIIVTSVITKLEVLDASLTADQERSFGECFSFGTHELYELDAGVALKAREYRSFYFKNPVGGKKLSVPDAIHLATAFICQSDEFHTFDDGGKGGISLLALNGNVAGNPIKICHPFLQGTKSLFTP